MALSSLLVGTPAAFWTQREFVALALEPATSPAALAGLVRDLRRVIKRWQRRVKDLELLLRLVSDPSVLSGGQRRLGRDAFLFSRREGRAPLSLRIVPPAPACSVAIVHLVSRAMLPARSVFAGLARLVLSLVEGRAAEVLGEGHVFNDRVTSND